jgi:hypothetical protein
MIVLSRGIKTIEAAAHGQVYRDMCAALDGEKNSARQRKAVETSQLAAAPVRAVTAHRGAGPVVLQRFNVLILLELLRHLGHLWVEAAKTDLSTKGVEAVAFCTPQAQERPNGRAITEQF